MNTEDVDRRVRKAVERILEDESLTSGLEDAAAKVLIGWGVAEVERRGQLAAQLGGEDVQQAVDRAVDRVRRVLKRVAKAAAAQGIAAPAELMNMLAVTLSQVEAEDAAVAAPEVAPAPEPEILLPSAVDLVTPAPPAVKEAAPPTPEAQGFLARLRRLFGK